MNREDEVLRIVNKMIAACEPIKQEDFNKIVRERESGLLEKIESEDQVIGIRPINMTTERNNYCISTLSLIATITDILIEKRLAFLLDEDGYLVGVKWYEKNE